MPKDDKVRAVLIVHVCSASGEPSAKAKISFKPQDGRSGALRYQSDVAGYVLDNVEPGSGWLELSQSGAADQRREISLNSGENHEQFVLGKRGVRTYFREKVRMPVEAEPDTYALMLVSQARRDEEKKRALLGQLRLDFQDEPELAARLGMHSFKLPSANAEEVLARLARNPAIEHLGAIVSMRETGYSFLTQDVIAQFAGPRLEEVRKIVKELGFTVTREIVYAPHTYVLRWHKPATLELLDAIERLAERKDVAWAEPSLAITPELDAITPTDFLWPGLWDRQLIGLPDAWQHLQDVGLDTFGDPDIVLAVWDSGTQSVGGVPTNADFSGTVSNGQPKVLASFDFINMVANNDTPWSDHGSGVAGVSAALANNASPVLGQNYGLTGSAPNVQIITCAGTTSTDLYVADQYIWMAGFDPQSPVAGFPATPPSRGADVITCSLTPGANATLSGIARATLDFVTSFGRGGKGTLCFFSTGNNNLNNVTARPYGAYEKCFGIAATSIDNDGITEIRAPFSGWGNIALCAPSHDQYVGTAPRHNPPVNYAAWSGAHAGAGNMISFMQSQTTLGAASVAGATTLTLASVAGFAVNGVIHIGPLGANGSEPARITAVNAGTNQLTLAAALLNAHGAGDIVQTGPANHKNNFGGTSSATPLCAGVAALVLSANPDLTFIEARQILRDTALKLNLANTDPTGQWLDAGGAPSVTSGLPAVRSQWYGWGRVDAAAAVEAAVSFAATRDLVIRDNLADTGAVASAGAFWNSPDIWCRLGTPASDPGALPAAYANAGPHQAPKRGQANWIYARVRNNGTANSLDAWVRLSVTHYPSMEFTYPASFQPTNGPGDPISSPMAPGTYFIGEAKVTGVLPGSDQIVSIEWPAGLIPPENVSTPAGNVVWHPCLLAEITPHDGPAATGNHVWDDNNLAQKNISIVNADSGTDFASAMVIGHQDNLAEFLYLEVNRGRLPREVQLYVDVMDRLLLRRMKAPRERQAFDPRMIRHEDDGELLTRPVLTHLPRLGRMSALRPDWTIGTHEAREVVLLSAQAKVRLPLHIGKGRLSPLVVGGIAGHNAAPGEYEIVLIQRQPGGEISGSATVMLNIGKQKRKLPK